MRVCSTPVQLLAGVAGTARQGGQGKRGKHALLQALSGKLMKQRVVRREIYQKHANNLPIEPGVVLMKHIIIKLHVLFCNVAGGSSGINNSRPADEATRPQHICRAACAPSTAVKANSKQQHSRNKFACKKH